jgi:hypothetical protein
MTYTFVSFAVFVLAIAFVTAVLLVSVSVLAGNVFHTWGTASAWEWIAEAMRRVFAGGLRRRFMKAVNAQRDVAVDRSRRVCSHIAVSIAPADAPSLAGPSGDLTRVAADAARGYARYARSNGLVCEVPPQVVVVPEVWLRRGSVRARSISSSEFAELWREMLGWDRDMQPGVPLDFEPDIELGTLLLQDATVSAAEIATEAVNQAAPASKPTPRPHLLLTDEQLTRHPVSTNSVIIGRGQDCGLRLDNPEISREHANIYFQEGAWWVRDRGSRNGTTVNGVQIKGTGPARLCPGSQLVLGSDAAGEKLTVSGLVHR